MTPSAGRPFSGHQRIPDQVFPTIPLPYFLITVLLVIILWILATAPYIRTCLRSTTDPTQVLKFGTSGVYLGSSRFLVLDWPDKIMVFPDGRSLARVQVFRTA